VGARPVSVWPLVDRRDVPGGQRVMRTAHHSETDGPGVHPGPSDQREGPATERERDGNAARRLAIIRHAQEVTGNVSKTCRYYGITRQAYYKWLRRHAGGGLEGLRDRSPRPHVSPKATKAEVGDAHPLPEVVSHPSPTSSRRSARGPSPPHLLASPGWRGCRCPG